MTRLRPRCRACLYLLLLPLPLPLAAAEATLDAQQSFSYISSTLQQLRAGGSLRTNPGIDESEIADFLALLEDAYQGFSADFNSESAMCRFYRDPENARMTIEERAELSTLYLRSVDARAELFARANREFQQALQERFGTAVLDRINERKRDAVSNQRLPASSFDEAATISFLDAMCA